MTLIFTWLTRLALVTAISFSNRDAIEVSGIVVNSVTKEPVGNVYIHAVKGEEESLSNGKGNFKLLCWKTPPVSVVFEKGGYKPQKILVNNDRRNLKVVLEPY